MYISKSKQSLLNTKVITNHKQQTPRYYPATKYYDKWLK